MVWLLAPRPVDSRGSNLTAIAARSPANAGQSATTSPTPESPMVVTAFNAPPSRPPGFGLVTYFQAPPFHRSISGLIGGPK